MKKLLFYCFILTLCTQCKNEVKTFQIDKAYIESLEKERKDRDKRRVKYLELCGFLNVTYKPLLDLKSVASSKGCR